MQFNESQKMAIKHGDGPMLVVAGPGSGKTTVLTMRIKNLIEEYKVNPGNILVITFTKAAALEMENRFIKLVGEKKYVTFGTFHGIFFRILKAAYNFSVDNIIKEEQRHLIIRQAIERLNILPDDINEFTDSVEAEISRVKTENININSYYSVSCGEKEFKEIYGYYEKTLKSSRLIDFDDMLLYCHELFVQRKDILKAWQDRYKYILVDEFQDINKIQYEVVKMLAQPENNLFVVGDDDQSIYGFRGSKPEIMMNYEKDYPDTRKVNLDTNYRSTANIVNAAKNVISHNKIRFNKNICTSNPPGEKVEICEFNTMNQEYERIISDIKAGIEAKKSYSEYAILFRTNTIAAPLVRKLMEYNMPFSVKDGIPNIFEHFIAKDIIAYMMLAMGERKRKYFLQVMNKPKRYVGRDYLTEEEISFRELEKYYEDRPWMTERLDTMELQLKIMNTMSPYAMINYLRKAVGYDEYLEEYAISKSIDEEELFLRADEIMETAKEFKTHRDWLNYIEEYTLKLRENNKKNNQDKDGVALTTMHSSKGLEYDTVYIIDANEEITPHKKASFDTELEEERRMFYVAMTRAKNRLNIFYAKKRFNKDMEVSRFVKEIMETQ